MIECKETFMIALLQIVELVGPNRAVQLFGVKLVGVNADNASKLLFTFAFAAFVVLFSSLLKKAAAGVLRKRHERYRFWTRQAIQVFSALFLVVGLVSIWFDDPTRLATALGLVTAGLAFALQRVVTAVAGYFVILRGETFSVGDRIVMGGVRGDVIALTFTQTTIMEMGQPPAVQNAPPAMWVGARQYTGRVVTVTNAKIFDEPVFNYSREFPFLWEELALPISYTSDRNRAEQILLDVARRHSVPASELSREALEEMRRRYFMEKVSTEPRVFWRITDNWVELTVRFVTREHGARDVKDKMSRDILQALDEAGIGIASATFEVVGLPQVKLQMESPSANVS
jgi:small-conductance mechanosensitive channel